MKASNLFRNSLLICLLISWIEAHAQDGSFTGIHHQYQNTRALGMGDAFTAVADDYSALFYNPAGLIFVDKGQFNGSIDLNVSSNFLSFNSSLSKASSNSSDANAQYTQIAELLNSNYGNVYGARFGLLHGIYARPRWAVGFLPMDFKLEMSVINQGVPGVSARAFADTTLAYGFAQDIRGLPGRLAWGTTFKFINRGYFSKSFNALDLMVDGNNLFKTSDMREGYTLDLDLGTMWRPDLPDEGFWSNLRHTRPTFSFVIRNALDYGFGRTLKLLNKQANTANPPEKLNRVFDLGSRWEYPKKWLFGGRGSFDIRDIGHPQWTFRKGFHAGLEFDWTVKSWWKGQYRFGLSQFFPSAGVSMLLGVFRLDLSTYSEDVGSSSSPRENRYYQLVLNLDI